MRRALLALGAITALLLFASEGSCARAPIGPYHGPYPAPGAITAFDTVMWRPHDETRAGAPAFLLPGSTNQALHKAGTLWLDPKADSVIILLYGDNRPGYRLATTAWGVPAVMGIGSQDFPQFLWGLVNIPVAAVQLVFPKMDILRDAWSFLYSHKFTGGAQNAVLKVLQREIGRDPRVSFVVQTGDVVEDGRRGAQWEDFVRLHGPLREKVPYLATVGNHERTFDATARKNWNAVMGSPAEDQRYWFAVDFPESIARFVFLDTNVLADPGDKYPDSLESKLANEELAWVDSALAVPARFKFVVEHHPLVTSGHYLSDWQYDDSKPAELSRRARLIDICRRRHVTAVLSGHEHLYQRSYIRGRDGRGFWHIGTGGGGAPLYRVTEREFKAANSVVLPDSSRVTYSQTHSVYNFARLTIVRRPKHGEGEHISLDVYGVTSRAKSYLLDHVDLTHPPPPGTP